MSGLFVLVLSQKGWYRGLRPVPFVGAGFLHTRTVQLRLWQQIDKTLATEEEMELGFRGE
jgi:hypothetical protein